MPNPQLIFGGLNIGGGGFNTAKDVSALLDEMSSLRLPRIDTAAVYPNACPGLSEQLLGDCRASDRQLVVDTKILPTGKAPLRADAIAASIDDSLRRLRCDISILYCHAPDPETPIRETAAELDRQYKLKKFRSLGLSNYSDTQTVEYINVCEEEGFIMPTTIQLQYNLLLRGKSREIQALRQSRDLKFVAYSPLAGGFLTGMFTEGAKLEGTRFEEGNQTGTWYKRIYDRAPMHETVIALRKICDRHGLRMTEVALRWLYHHSVLEEKDGFIIGASNIAQLRENLSDIAKGPLPRDVMSQIDEL
ncbi:Aldo/keto reductase [Xylariaceae sp. FL0255]|nr:Aldo/keto reductase [Xylariaceae sp. FL0255]